MKENPLKGEKTTLENESESFKRFFTCYGFESHTSHNLERTFSFHLFMCFIVLPPFYYSMCHLISSISIYFWALVGDKARSNDEIFDMSVHHCPHHCPHCQIFLPTWLHLHLHLNLATLETA